MVCFYRSNSTPQVKKCLYIAFSNGRNQILNPLKGVDWCVEVHVHCNVFVRIDIWSALLGKEFDPKRTRKRKKKLKAIMQMGIDVGDLTHEMVYFHLTRNGSFSFHFEIEKIMFLLIATCSATKILFVTGAILHTWSL